MASTTTNIGLTKPAGTDQALISAINGNMDIIDTKMGAVGNTSVQSQITSLSDQIGNFRLIKIDKVVTIPDGTGTYQDVTIDFSNDIPSGKVIHSFSEARLDKYALPYISGSQVTRISEVNDRSIIIKSNSSAWNNYVLHIALLVV